MSKRGIVERPSSSFQIQPQFKNMVGWFLRSMEKPLFGIHVDIDGLANLTGLSASAIIAPNHLSLADPLFDTVFMHCHVRDRKTYIAAKDSLWKPVLGKAIEKIGAWPVDRSGDPAASERFVAIGRNLLERGDHLLVYPQGTRRAIDEVLTKRGAIALSLAANVPLVPMGQMGTHEAYDPRDRGPVAVVIGEPIYPTQYTGLEGDTTEAGSFESLNRGARIQAIKNHHAAFDIAFQAVCAQAQNRYAELTA